MACERNNFTEEEICLDITVDGLATLFCLRLVDKREIEFTSSGPRWLCLTALLFLHIETRLQLFLSRAPSMYNTPLDHKVGQIKLLLQCIWKMKLFTPKFGT